MIKRRIAGSAIALSVILGVAACGSARTESLGTSSENSGVEVGDNDVRVIEVEGVMCIIADGYDATAISCNWEAYNSKTTP